MPNRRRLACFGTAASLALLAAGSVAPSRPVIAAAPATTQFTFTSQSGDPVGQGATTAYTPALASFAISGTAQSVTVSIRTPVDAWTATFAGPPGHALTVGSYANAMTAGSQGTQPGLAVFDGFQRNCGGSVAGSFTVNAIATGASGAVTVLDVSFTQWCSPNGWTVPPPVMQGRVEYAAPATVSLATPPNMVSGTFSSGTDAVYTITVDPQGAGAPTGTVSLQDGPSTTLATVGLDVNGQAVFGWALPEGTHLLSASYGGDAHHPAGSSATTVLKVDRQPSTTSYSWTSAAGDPVALGASGTLSPPSASFTLTGTLGDATLRTTTSSASWTIEIKPALGGTLQPGASYTAGSDSNGPRLTVTDNGRTCSGGQFTVRSIGSDWWGGLTALDASFTQSCGGGATTLSGTLQDAAPPDGPNPLTITRVTPSGSSVADGTVITLQAAVVTHSSTSGTVRFMDGATPVADVAIDSTGHAATSIQMNGGGLHIISASYLGDGSNQATTGLLEETVVQPPPQPAATTTSLSATPTSTTLGQSVTLQALVSSGANGVPTGHVTFYDGATTLGVGALDGSGTATLATSSLSSGAHQVSANYGGDSLHFGSRSGLVAVTVVSPTSTALSASTNNATVGSPVTFTATVTSKSGNVPTGRVTFSDGSTVLGSASLDSQGVGRLTTSSLSLGTHSITASYGGDTVDTASSSTALRVIVRYPTTTTLRTLLTTVVGVASLQIAVTSPYGSTPAGTVTVYDGATAVVTVTLDNQGRASVLVSHLSRGKHYFSATYNGSTIDATSTSAVLVITSI